MAVNKNGPHLHLLPEDAEDADLARGFLLELKDRRPGAQVHVLPPGGGWVKTLEHFEANLVADMRRYAQRRTVIVIDFDETKDRRERAQAYIPVDLQDRVFVVGSWKEPKDLKRELRCTLEEIGRRLGKECVERTWALWEHRLLHHNVDHVRPLGPFIQELIS